MILGVVVILFFENSCNNNKELDFYADFSYEFTDSNHVQFSNTSTGEYYSLTWDFGNGQTETTTDKKQDFNIYYPTKGDYLVNLKLTNYSGSHQFAEKTITISSDQTSLSFSAVIEPSSPNYVLLTNTSQGTFDSFKWIYDNKEIDNQEQYTAYFPFAGNYDIKLQVSKDNILSNVTKTVNITQDDPNYEQNLTLVWSDEFDGTSVNANNWTFETGATGWGNNELQNYTSSGNAVVAGGFLTITAKKINDLTQIGSYTSARLNSKSKKEFQYGKMEIRAKLPSGTGIWPAIWMLGSNFSTAGWPACGEIDIMEYVGYTPNTVYSTVHTPAGYGGSGSGNSSIVETCEEEFHIYGLLWTSTKLIFYVDVPTNIVHTYEPSVRTADNWPFDQAAFFILNVAVGGSWGGAQGVDNLIFPQSMIIDYVRVYQ